MHKRDMLLNVDSSGRVVGFHYKADEYARNKPKKFAERLKEGFLIECEDFPVAPEVNRGEDALLYVKEGVMALKGQKIAGKDLEWKVVQRPLTESEVMEDLVQQQEKTNELLSEIIRVLTKE